MVFEHQFVYLYVIFTFMQIILSPLIIYDNIITFNAFFPCKSNDSGRIPRKCASKSARRDKEFSESAIWNAFRTHTLRWTKSGRSREIFEIIS